MVSYPTKYRRKTPRKFVKKVMSVPQRLKKVERKIRRDERSVELKYTDTAISPSALSTSVDIYLLNGLAGGTSGTQRIGNLFTNYALRLDINFQVNTAIAADVSNICHFWVVWDTNPQGATPVSTDFLDANFNLWESFPKFENRRRFKVLCDKTVTLYQDGPGNVSLKKYIRLNRKTYNLNSGNTITGIQKGALFLFVTSDSSAVPHPTYQYSARLTYKDQ